MTLVEFANSSSATIHKKKVKPLKFFSRRFFVLGHPAVEEEWTRDDVMRESNQFRDIILVR
jgi:hypothetical protein